MSPKVVALLLLISTVILLSAYGLIASRGDNLSDADSESDSLNLDKSVVRTPTTKDLPIVRQSLPNPIEDLGFSFLQTRGGGGNSVTPATPGVNSLNDGPLSDDYIGVVHYMPEYDYAFYINTTQRTIRFRGLNSTNQYTDILIAYDSTNHFIQRINYVWFNGWFDSQNLYINDYVGTGNSYLAIANETSSGIYDSQVIVSESPYLGINYSVVVNVSMDTNTNMSTLSPETYLTYATISPIDSVWQAAGHPYELILYQAALSHNGMEHIIEISEWVKVDLGIIGATPRWTSSLQSLAPGLIPVSSVVSTADFAIPFDIESFSTDNIDIPGL
ncbi:MAG: hypothetical protein ACP5NS_00235 [Candidatus Pacearchaeota archaeon]